jgi:NADH-quinone oxidoreductase subunit H
MDAPFLVVAVLNLVFVMGLLLNLAGLLTWVERKQGAVMANRIGANRAYIPVPVGRDPQGALGFKWSKRFTLMGLFHAIADGVKMLTKEDYTPPFVDKPIYNLAVWFAVVPVLVTFAVVPFGGPFQPGVMLHEVFSAIGLTGIAEAVRGFFGDRVLQLQLADLNVGMLFVFAVGSTGIFAAGLAGWSSGNKFSLLGALRASSQMISYEVFMGMSLLGLLVVYGSVDLGEIAQMQGGTVLGAIPRWGIVLQPHMFFVFFTALMAENKRVPFDMPEAESELVAGYFTEYSAMKMGLFMMAEFIEIAVIAGIMTALFLGAYHVPGVHAATDAWYWAQHAGEVPRNVIFGAEVPHAAVVVVRVVSFLVKVVFLCWLQVLVRWTLPKFRYDQVMRLGWKMLLPISIVNAVLTAVVVTLLGSGGNP